MAILWMVAGGSELLLPKKSVAEPFPDIAIAKGATAAATRAAVELLGGMKQVVKPGNRVIIKPNMSFPTPPERASNTHPEVVRELAFMCKEAGASKILVLDNTLSSKERCLEKSGIREACKAIDNKMVFALSDDSLYKATDIPRFATQMFIIAIFGVMFALARVSPRFWCRNLCSSGALMALLSKKPFIRRCVSEGCTECGKCVRACPMGAIFTENPRITHHEECITCLTCEKVCPEKVISFSHAKTDYGSDIGEPAYSRRQFVITGLIGIGTAVTSLTGLSSLYGKPGPGQVTTPGLIRPPGALPEMDFLSRCVRCGECMAACPTNTLQPIWLKAGFSGLFSPALTPRRSYCNPECHKCGEVCPTGAIRMLSSNERIWAKTGTAMIFRRKCLAWEHQKSCMVCDEVCPFKAVEFRKEPGNPVPVPQVREEKCAGCGYCEHFCPVQNQSAIVVTPMGALRMSEGSYAAQGKRQGLNLSIKPKSEYGPQPAGKDWDKGFAPGFEDDKPNVLPPGFEKDGPKSPGPQFHNP